MHIYRRKSTKGEIKHNCFLYSYKYINYIIYLIIGIPSLKFLKLASFFFFFWILRYIGKKHSQA